MPLSADEKNIIYSNNMENIDMNEINKDFYKFMIHDFTEGLRGRKRCKDLYYMLTDDGTHLLLPRTKNVRKVKDCLLDILVERYSI